MKLCFYHRVDFDGVCSGAIVKHFNPDVELIGINHGDPFPWDKVKDNDIIMVDYCLEPFEDMIRLAITANTLTWIDHHRTAINAMKDYEDKYRKMPYIAGIQRVGEAACELTWQWYYETDAPLYRDKPIPIGVRFVGRYDVWDLDYDAHVLPFQYGLRSVPDIYNPHNDMWEFLFRWPTVGELARWITNGNVILNYTKSWNKYLMDNFSFEGKFLGHDALFINMPSISTATFESRYDEEKHDLMVGFCWGQLGKWQVSLRSTKIDVGEIARRLGGGGHKEASGFSTDFPPWRMTELSPNFHSKGVL